MSSDELYKDSFAKPENDHRFAHKLLEEAAAGMMAGAALHRNRAGMAVGATLGLAYGLAESYTPFYKLTGGKPLLSDGHSMTLTEKIVDDGLAGLCAATAMGPKFLSFRTAGIGFAAGAAFAVFKHFTVDDGFDDAAARLTNQFGGPTEPINHRPIQQHEVLQDQMSGPSNPKSEDSNNNAKHNNEISVVPPYQPPVDFRASQNLHPLIQNNNFQLPKLELKNHDALVEALKQRAAFPDLQGSGEVLQKPAPLQFR